jgi:hypothetical protein
MTSVNAAVAEAKAAKRTFETARDAARTAANFTAAFDRTAGDITRRVAAWRRPRARRAVHQQRDVRVAEEAQERLPSGTWTSPASEMMAATLTEDSASGGDLVIMDTRPGILPLPQRPLVMADLMAPGMTESNVVTYMKETTFTNDHLRRGQ